ncbi:uncharacterized protein LOC135384887 [Ornithodoros turicata]|uniref:uncharacterized protein LOC135384887 n=1 Tax=Ornithodoros turicata TaxID=34597 RepID=UPI003138E621
MPEPTNVGELRAFLGLVQYYGRYVKSLSDLFAPLNQLLRNNVPWEWSSGRAQAFREIERRLTSIDSLAHFDPSQTLDMAADASSSPDPDFEAAISDDDFLVGSTGSPNVSSVLSVGIDKIPLKASAIAKATASDRILSKVYRYIMEGWPSRERDPELQPYYLRNTELTTEKGCTIWGMRVVVPSQHRNTVLNLLHDGHIGQTKMARSYVWWPGMDNDIELTCQRLPDCGSLPAATKFG